jgi:hypothetical protein
VLLLLLGHSLADGLLQGLLEGLQSGGWLRSGRGGTHRRRHIGLLLLGWWWAAVVLLLLLLLLLQLGWWVLLLLLLHGHWHGQRGVDGLRLWRQLLLVGRGRRPGRPLVGRRQLVNKRRLGLGLLRLCTGRLSLVGANKHVSNWAEAPEAGGAPPGVPRAV